MRYDDLDLPQHLRLDMPTVEQLARNCEAPVTDEVRRAILNHAATDADVYSVHLRTHQVHHDVTIGQVARVLLEAAA